MNANLQANLTWRQARTLGRAGQLVRRALWVDWLMYQSGLWFVTPDGSFSPETHVVKDFEFGKTEFLAMDWTNIDPTQNACLGLPPLTATLVISPAAVNDGDSATATLTIPSAQLEDTVFILTATPGGVVSLPATVTIPAGSASVTFPVSAPPPGTPSNAVTVTASQIIFGVAQASLSIQDVELPAPPPPAPQPAVQSVYLYQQVPTAPSTGNLADPPEYCQQTISNPLAGAANVQITGSAADNLKVNGILVDAPIGFNGSVNYSFLLGPGRSFTLASLNVWGGFTGYNLQITYTP